jgi:DNA-binding response OmpR family regulator
MKKKSILIVEDSAFLAASLVDMLSLRDYETIVAPTGKMGVDLAIAKKPDLILLDIRLPDIDGYEVYARIRKDSWGKKSNIVVLTASESIENISKNVDLPKDRILFKPEWSVRDLLDKIDSLVS